MRRLPKILLIAGASAVGLVVVLMIAGWLGVGSIGADLVLLTLVNGAAAAGRFVLLRRWAFR